MHFLKKKLKKAYVENWAFFIIRLRISYDHGIKPKNIVIIVTENLCFEVIRWIFFLVRRRRDRYRKSVIYPHANNPIPHIHLHLLDPLSPRPPPPVLSSPSPSHSSPFLPSLTKNPPNKKQTLIKQITNLNPKVPTARLSFTYSVVPCATTNTLSMQHNYNPH